MGRRHLAFDIETAKEVPGEDFNWRPHRPLGIACAATLASDSSEVRLWYGKTKDGAPGSQMTRADAKSLVQYLVKMAGDGYTILTWNGLGFDFDVLAEESGAAASCKQCALEHVDMMFHIVCSLGYPVSLESAARGMGLAGKPAGMSGIQAPRSGPRAATRKCSNTSPRTCGPRSRLLGPPRSDGGSNGSLARAPRKRCPYKVAGSP